MGRPQDECGWLVSFLMIFFPPDGSLPVGLRCAICMQEWNQRLERYPTRGMDCLYLTINIRISNGCKHFLS